MLKKAVMLSVVCCVAFLAFGCAKKLSKEVSKAAKN